jgi:hypothetical protein
MSNMFAGASSFNQPLAAWDVQRVVAMDHIFAGASSFRQSLDTWELNEDLISNHHKRSSQETIEQIKSKILSTTAL